MKAAVQCNFQRKFGNPYSIQRVDNPMIMMMMKLLNDLADVRVAPSPLQQCIYTHMHKGEMKRKAGLHV